MITVNFVDYAVAFDSVSHKFLDETLCRVGASNKMRVMVRAVYASATAFTTVPDTNDKTIKTDEFRIRCGVPQRDIMSPLIFILVLEFILRKHDHLHAKEVQLGAKRIHTLGYADDLSLTDNGNADGIAMASARVTSIGAGSEKDGDMKIKIKKTR